MLLPHLERMSPKLPSGQQVAFVFDQNNQFSVDALRAFNEIKELRDRHNRMGSILFRPRTDCPPLLAADLVVYLIRDDLSRLSRGTERRDIVDRLIQRQNLLVGYYDKDNLAAYVEGIRENRGKNIEALLQTSG